MKKNEMEKTLQSLKNDIEILNQKYDQLLDEILERDKISPFPMI